MQFIIQPHCRGGNLLFKLLVWENVQGSPTTPHHLVGHGPSFPPFLPSSAPPCPISLPSPSLCAPHTPLPYFLPSLCNSSAFMLLPSIQFAPILSIPLCTLRPPQLRPLAGRELGGAEGVWLVREPLVVLDEGDWKEGQEAASWWLLVLPNVSLHTIAVAFWGVEQCSKSPLVINSNRVVASQKRMLPFCWMTVEFWVLLHFL